LFGRGKAETIVGEFGAGLQQGARQVISTLPTLGAIGVAALEDSTGWDSNGLAQALAQTGEQIADGGAQRGVASVEDLRFMDPINWAKYVAGTLGETAPFILSIMSGAGAARVLADKMVRKGVPASTRAGILASLPAEGIGAFTTASGIEAAATSQELHKATGDISPLTSLAAGGLKGAAESVFPLMLSKGLGLTGAEASNLLERIYLGQTSKLGRALTGAMVEGGTEALQEEIDIQARNFLDEKYSATGPDAWSRRLNALVGGAVGGGFLSAFVGHEPHEKLNDFEIRKASGDVPIVTGQDVNELPVSGPEEVIMRAPNGIDATVGAANALERDQLLSEVDLRKRGLYAAVIDGAEPVFGTQDQALNDGAVGGGKGFLRLDPSKVNRGDITAAVEDLPDTLNSPRVDFLDPANMGAASSALVEAIKLKNDALKARTGINMEQNIALARAKYREAVNLGARIEPVSDSQVMLRDPSKAAQLAESVDKIQSQLTQAGLKETRTLSNGKKFYVMSRGQGETEDSGFKGRRVDLENIDPNNVTALPTRDLTQRLLASSEVSRKFNLGRARAMGIRFVGNLSDARKTALLRLYTRLARSITGGLEFSKQPGPIVDRFMALVNAGLRLDVHQGTDEFALLEQLRERELSMPAEQVGPRVSKDDQLKRLVKSRARRERDPRVSKYVQYHDAATEELFLAQHHHSGLQKVLVGEVEGGAKYKTKYKVKPSPIGAMLRDIVKNFGIKTDYVVEIVPPSVMPDRGVKYVEKDIIPSGGKVSQSRSVIMVNPWFYAKPTLGGKQLTRRDMTWAYLGGPVVKILHNTPANKRRMVIGADGTVRSLGQETAARLERPDHDILVKYPNGVSKPPVVMATGPYDALVASLKEDIDGKKLAPIEDADVSQVERWINWKGNPLGQLGDSAQSVREQLPDGQIDNAKLQQFLNNMVSQKNLKVANEFLNITRSGNDQITMLMKNAEGKEIAKFVVEPDGEKANAVTVTDAYVAPELRRKRVATHAYDFIEKIANGAGLQLVPGNAQSVTTQGEAFWKSRLTGNMPAFPKRGAALSSAAKLAKKMGTGSSKLTADEEQVTEFFADFSKAVAENVVTFEWGATSADMQDLIKTAYRREMHLAKGQDRARQMAMTIPHPLVLRTIEGYKGAKFEQYQFEEWLVNQVARYMTQPVKVIGPVAKFFSKMGSRIKGIIDALHKKVLAGISPFAFDTKQGAPVEAVQKWLEQLELRGLTNADPPFLDQKTRDVLIDSINKNQARFKALGIDQYVVAQPEKASTFQVRELLKILPREHGEGRKRLEALLAMADKHSTMLEWLTGIHQLADLNPHIQGLQVYKSATRAMENRAMGWATLADERIREAQKLGKAQMDGLWGLMFDLDNMVYLDQKKLAKGEEKPRWPKPEELLALVRKHKLDKKSFQVYVDIRNDFLQFTSYLENVSIQQARETVSDPELLNDRIMEIRGETEQLRQKPYFPHMRFGKYALTVRGEKNKVVHFETFATKKDRDAAGVELSKRLGGPRSVKIEEDEIGEHLRQWQGLPRYALKNVERALGLNEEDLTAQQKRDKITLEKMAMQNLGTTSFRHQLAGRKNTPGYSMDGMRAYANYFARSSKFMSRMEYAHTLEDAIQSVRTTGSPISRDARTRIADLMTRHYEAQMQPAGDWAEVRALGFLWYFAFVPAAAVTNLTQVPMVSLPFLAGKFGDLKTMGRVTQAYAENSKEFFDWLRGKPIEESPKQEALEEAHFNRLIDDGYATELAATSQGPVLQRTLPGANWQRGLRRLAQWGTAPFALAERINRSVTFRAAFDLAMNNNDVAWIDQVMAENKVEADQLRIDRGWDEKTLRSYMAAADALRRTQFEYGRWTRPKLMEGARGVVFMFKNYLQNMLYFMFKSDRKIQARFMLMMLATAGLMGLPGADDANELAKWLARQWNLPFDFERMVRQMMLDWGADGAISPDIVLHGAAREGFGVSQALNTIGVPAPRVDLSGALSMGRIIPGLKEVLNPRGDTGAEAIGNAVSQMAGPVLGVPMALYNSILDSSLPASDPKRWERAMPRAARAVTRASRLLAEQMERDRNGTAVMRFDPNDMNDQMDILAGVGLGFQPTRLNQTWDLLSARKEVQDYWKGQRDILMREFYRSIQLKDLEARKDATEAIKRYNKDVPDRGLIISSDAVRKSVQTRTKDRLYKEKDIPRERMFRGVTKQVDTLYPEVERKRVPME
jgi:hypothetical protein